MGGPQMSSFAWMDVFVEVPLTIWFEYSDREVIESQNTIISKMKRLQFDADRKLTSFTEEVKII